MQRYLLKTGDARKVVADEQARYFGALLEDDTLVPGPGPRLGEVGFETWFSSANAKK
ncbi:hypothetical protein D9M68_588170 [compost metagenome]